MADQKRKLNAVMIPTREGGLARYIAVLDRTPIVLEKFPPEKGWGIVIETSDPNGWFASGMELRKTFLESVHSGEEPTPYVQGILARRLNVKFEAKLVNPEGRTVANESCMHQIKVHEDWALGVTNARRRLYEVIGCGSDTLLKDPTYEIVELDDNDAGAKERLAEMSPSPAEAAEGEAPEASPPEGGTKASAPQAPVPAVSHKGNGAGPGDLTTKEETKKRNYRRQIESIIELRGLKDVKIPEDLGGLKALYKKLSADKTPTAH